MLKFGFKFGLVLGGLVGYTLGAKAGRPRYEQIMRMLRSLGASPPAQRVGTEVRAAADRAGQTVSAKANEGITKLTDRVRSGSDGGPTPAQPQPRTGDPQPQDPTTR